MLDIDYWKQKILLASIKVAGGTVPFSVSEPECYEFP